MGIPFTKMHGLGNDYHYIDCTTRTIADPAELSRKMSHRHLGAGSDGIILVLPGQTAARPRPAAMDCAASASMSTNAA
jgi:diaminopimelate epimerase